MIVPLTPLEFRQRAVNLYGAKTGIVDGGKRFTYAEYDQRINRFANGLVHLGLKKGNFETLAGFIEHRLKRIPKKGEKIKLKKVTIQVDKVDKKEIKSVKILKD